MKEQVDDNFTNRLSNHPTLKARFQAILDVAENTRGDVISAHEAEQQAIEQVRQLGNELLHDWAHRRIDASADQLKNEQEGVVGNGKKT